MEPAWRHSPLTPSSHCLKTHSLLTLLLHTPRVGYALQHRSAWAMSKRNTYARSKPSRHRVHGKEIHNFGSAGLQRMKLRRKLICIAD